eukprot:CAMPEP_0169115804 /NCGR_PEP_ID=MMETSP1015-20121227/29538_1 /TAXON_ID=342587 /ORGANISM="Karlodinium micrum, Strain CCMP2283" /LENGTH=401 /DNA_ID=CAMNT_0009178281 /DNA_START=81 /DNA_END=1286 /DNA_ORIENTATION=-
MIAVISFTVTLGCISASPPPIINDQAKPIFVDAESSLTISKRSKQRYSDYEEFLERAAAEATKLRLEALLQSGVAPETLKRIGINQAMIETLSFMTADHQLAPIWWAAMAILIVFLGVPLLFMCLFPHDILPNADFVSSGKKPAGYGKAGTPQFSQYQPMGSGPLASRTHSQSTQGSSPPPGATALSPFTAAMSANMSFVERHLSPESASRSVWSVGSNPPPLCGAIAPAQSMTSFHIEKAALRNLYNHGRIEILDKYNKVAAFASLSPGAGGTGLVVACEPSCSDPVATVGPLDYPAQLDSQAMLHGPYRELYGPFERFGEGFAVSHFSRQGHVFTSTPKRVANGLVVEVSAAGKQLASAWLMSYKGHCQIDVNAGIDITLMLSTVLATCVASQHVIDAV